MTARTKPPFRADHVGSLIRPDALIAARNKAEKNEIDAAELRRTQQDAIREVVRLQESIGFKVVTDGEYNRGGWQRDFLLRFANVKLVPSKLTVRFHSQTGVRDHSPPAMQIVGTFVHNDRCGTLGPLEWVFVTPSHHRVHHASNPRYLDKNIGMTLIVWDRLFGTFVAEDPRDPVRYGITRPVTDRGPVNILLHEWRDIARDVRAARNWRERFRYVFGAPGWTPPGASASPAPSRIAGTPVK